MTQNSFNKKISPKLGITFHLDTNRINVNGKLSEINKLEKWHRRGLIELEWSEPVFEELIKNNKRFQKAHKRLVARPSITTSEEQKKLREIEDIVFPNGVCDENEKNDLYALFSAKKYLAIFVTDDGSGGKPRGILTHQSELEKIGVRVMRDTEAVNHIDNILKKMINTYVRWLHLTQSSTFKKKCSPPKSSSPLNNAIACARRKILPICPPCQ